MGKRYDRWIRLLCLLALMPFLLSQQTQNLPARADNISPGFSILEQAKQLKVEQKYDEGFKKALDAAVLLQKDTAWLAWGESLELAYQCAFRQGERANFQALLTELLAREQIAESKQIPAKTKAIIFGRIGSCRHFTGDYSNAIAYYEKALPFAEISRDTALLSRLYGNNGVLIWDQGDDFRARPYLEKALDLATIRKDTALMVNIAGCLGNVLRTLNSDRCIPVLQQALSLDPVSSKTMVLLSKAFLEMQFNLKQALKYAAAALNHAEDDIERADAINQLGRVYLNMHDPDKALKSFSTALEVASRGYGERHPECIKTYVYMGDAWLMKHLPEKSLATYNTALEKLLPLFHPSDNRQDPTELELTASSLWVMDALLGKTKAWQAAFETAQDPEFLNHSLHCAELAIYYQNKAKLKFSDDESKFSLNNYFIPSYENALNIAFLLYQHGGSRESLERAFAIAEQTKGVVLSEALYRKEIKSVVGIPPEILEQEKTDQVQQAAYEKKILECSDPGQMPALKDSLFQARRKAEVLENSIRQQFPVYSDAIFGYQSHVFADSISKNLPENTALLEYFLGDSTIFTFVVSKDTCWGQKQLLPAGFHEKLNTYLRTVRDWKFVADSASRANEIFLSSGYELYRLLLEKPLALTRANRLFIVPDGQLSFLPFELLLTHGYSGKWIDRDVPYVLKDRVVSYRFSGRLTSARNPVPASGEGWGGFGLEYNDSVSPENTPEHTRDMGPLPFADEEIMLVSSLLGGDFWLNSEATRENFLKNAEHYKILHLAMHGIVDENNSLHSKLVFSSQIAGSDPAVYASDLYQMQLRAGLAVLSACQSGTGALKNGEGVMSLARAFAFAGCPSMVMSLWNVSDQSTSEIMVDFYKQLKSGASKDEALRNAKLAYLEHAPAEYAKPIYWAAFVPIGEMDSMDSSIFFNWRSLFRITKICALAILFLLLARRWFLYRKGDQTAIFSGL